MTSDPDLSGVAPTLGLLIGRWVLAIVDETVAAPMRHSELMAAIGGISEKVLTETLRRMERDGLVAREASSGVPNHVAYRATALARSLDEPLRALLDWQSVHWDAVELARSRWSEA